MNYPKLKAKFLQTIYRYKINLQYSQWQRKNSPSSKELLRQQKTKFKYQPLISIIVPVYNVDPSFLEECIASVKNQTYQNWQLCLADDASSNPKIKEILQKHASADQRIVFTIRPENGHISAASNSALELANGEFIALLDHDDTLAPQALFKVVQLLNKQHDIDFIYSDEDKIDPDSNYIEPSFKPDFSLDMLLSTNYICHFSIIRKRLVDQIGAFRLGFEGSQDYDLFLRVASATNKIQHIPDILYHWRKVPGSTAAVYSDKSYANTASIRALTDYLSSHKINASVENGLQPGTFRINYKIKGNPLVSIIIPSKNKQDFLKTCIDSILNKSTYSNYEILIVDTGSDEKSAKDYLKLISHKSKIKVINWSKEFNFSEINNFATTHSRGDYLLFLNNDTQVITPDWIEALLSQAQRSEIGAVGCKLVYPNQTLQHAGVLLGVGGIANHSYYRMPDLVSQPFPQLNSKDMIRNYLAVTGACLMISKSKFNQIKGFDPDYAFAYNDIDLCLRLIQKGYHNLYTPYAKLFHFESTTINTNRNQEIFLQEQELFKSKWQQYIDSDPFYNPNLSRTQTDCSLSI